MIIMDEEELIKEIIDRIRMLGFKNVSIETAGYLRFEDINGLYKHKLEEYSSPIYFPDERFEIKKAYVFLKSLFENSNIIEIGELFSPEYRPNLQVEVMKAIRDSERVEKEALKEQSKEDAIEYNDRVEKINAEKYVARRNYYANKTKIERKLKKIKKNKNKHH